MPAELWLPLERHMEPRNGGELMAKVYPIRANKLMPLDPVELKWTLDTPSWAHLNHFGIIFQSVCW